MAGVIIRPEDLTPRPSPVASELMVVDNGVNVGAATIKAIVEAGRPAASQSEAQVGTDPSKAMTPLTTKQSIAAEVGVSVASKAQGDLANSAVQPGSLSAVATSGAYADLSGKPALGTAATTDATAYATAAQGALAEGALRSIVEGNGISVDTTDPKNPVVSAPGNLPTIQPEDAGKVLTAKNDATGSEWRETSILVVPPQGRLTLTSGAPIQITDAVAATSIFYTPFQGDRLPVFDGTRYVMKTFAELSLALNANAGHAGYHQAAKNFDLFVFDDGGTLRLGSGPAWASDNARGTGPGTTELERVGGLLVNKNAITVRFGNASGNTIALAARAGIFLGSFRTTADGQTEFTIAPAPAAGGTNNKLFLANAYNQVPVIAKCREANNWFYTVLAPLGSANASASNRISFLCCLPETAVIAEFRTTLAIGTGATTYGQLAVGLDTTTISSGLRTLCGGTPGFNAAVQGDYCGTPGVGLHFVQALSGTVGTGWGTSGYRVDFTGGDLFSLSLGLQN